MMEEFLRNRIFPDLEHARPDWDLPHTIAVVEKVKDIMENSLCEDVDKEVLIIAAYAHDWGYSGLFKEGKPLSYTDVKSMRENHAEMDAKRLDELLHDPFFDRLSDDRKQRAVYLVRVHDSVFRLNITDHDVKILFEADILGALDVAIVKPTFDKISNQKYLETVRTIMRPHFFTTHGKNELNRLIKLREDFYINTT